MNQIMSDTKPLEVRIEEVPLFKEAASKDYQITGPNRPDGYARIIIDSRERGARAMFLSTRNKSMKQFVEKKEFVLLGSFGVGDGYYLML